MWNMAAMAGPRSSASAARVPMATIEKYLHNLYVCGRTSFSACRETLPELPDTNCRTAGRHACGMPTDLRRYRFAGAECPR